MRSQIRPKTGPASEKMLPKIGCQDRTVSGMINSGMHLADNSGPNSGRQHLFLAKQRPDAVSNSGFLTFRMVCHSKSDTWLSNVPSMGWTLDFLFSELNIIVKVTIG